MTSQSSAIARGVSLQLLARVLAMPLGFLTLGITARYLGPHDYGMLTSAIVFVGIFQMLTDLGVGTVIVRRVASGRGVLQNLVGLNITLSLAYALPVVGLTWVVGGWLHGFDSETTAAILIIGTGLGVSCIATCFDPVFDVHVRYGVVAAGEIMSRVVSLLLTLLIVQFDAGLVGIAFIQIVQPLIKLVCGWFGARRLGAVSVKGIGSQTLSLIREAAPFALMSAIGVAYWRADGLILSVVSTEYEVAAYGIALQIAFALTVLPNVFGKSAFSTIARHYVSDMKRYRDAVGRGYELMLLLAAPIAVFGYALAAPLTRLVASDAYVDKAAPVLRLFFAAVALGFLTTLASVALIAASRQRILTVLSVATLGLNVIANILLAREYGALSAGMVLVATEGLGVAVSQYLLWKMGVRAFPIKYSLRLLPGLAMGLVLIELGLAFSTIGAVAAAGVAYFGVTWLCGAVPPSMRVALRGGLGSRAK